MWPIVFTRIMQLLGRSYRFVVTRSTEAHKYLPASDVAADDATEALWMQTYGVISRDRLEHAVYTLIQAAWDYPEAKVHFRTIYAAGLSLRTRHLPQTPSRVPA